MGVIVVVVVVLVELIHIVLYCNGLSLKLVKIVLVRYTASISAIDLCVTC